MGPEGEKIVKKTYEIYSRDHDISFQEYIDRIVSDKKMEDVFVELFEKVQEEEIYKN